MILDLFRMPKPLKFKKIGRFLTKQSPFTQYFAKQPDIFLFPKFLKLFFIPKNTTPKV